MKKKFKLKLSHYSEDYYVIKYAYYWFIPIWSEVSQWFEVGYTSQLEQFRSKLVKITDEESIKKQFPTIESIYAYHAIEKQKEKDFYIKKKAYLEKVTPYKSKTLIIK